MAIAHRIAPCLWFDSEGEDAANFYVGIFPNSGIRKTARYGEAGKEIHRRPAGSVMTVDFELDGAALAQMFGDPKDPGSQRAMQALLQMKKIDIKELERAYAGA